MADVMATLRKVGGDMQGVAMFLVLVGSAMMWVACKDNFPELKTLAASIAGAGLQAITSQIRSSLQAGKDGATATATTTT